MADNSGCGPGTLEDVPSRSDVRMCGAKGLRRNGRACEPFRPVARFTREFSLVGEEDFGPISALVKTFVAQGEKRRRLVCSPAGRLPNLPRHGAPWLPVQHVRGEGPCGRDRLPAASRCPSARGRASCLSRPPSRQVASKRSMSKPGCAT